MRVDAAGALSATARDGRSWALWRAARDGSTPVIARCVARFVSAYERAPVRDIVALGLFSVVEGAATAIMVRAALAITGVPAASAEGDGPPGSGWRGTMLALAIWLLPFVVVAVVARR